MGLIILVGPYFFYRANWGERRPNDYEEQYDRIAKDYMKSPELCYRIYRKALARGFDSRTPLRSSCFFEVAQYTKNTSLCEEVGEKGTYTWRSKDICVSEIEGLGDKEYRGPGFILGLDVLQSMLRDMGYSDAEIDTITPEKIDSEIGLNKWIVANKIAGELLKTERFKNNIDKLPDFNQ